jgi:hypothetical protein
MTHDLQQLELRRMEIFKEISSLGDFRAGSITSLMRRCGKKECHCSQAGDPGHGPTLRLTYNRKGKSYTEMLPDRESEEKARREIAEFRRFQELSKELVEISGQICRLRPAEDRESEQSKKNFRRRRSSKRSGRK